MPPEAFLSPERAADLFEERRRGVRVLSYCWRTGMNDPDGRTLEKIRGYLNVERGRGGDCGLFVDFACIPQAFAWPSWHASEASTLRFGSEVNLQGPLAVLKFELECVATEDEAQVCVDKLVSLCEENQWELASIADFKSLGPSSHDNVGVLFHGRYLRGVYRFDEGACRRLPKALRGTAEGYMRFRTEGDAQAAHQNLELKRMCGGKEPQLMGEHVFENELKFKRGLSVMGCLYASATGTCVLQLTDPPGKLGEEVAPDELVSERTGTVFILELQKELGNKSLDELQKVLQKELGDGVLACEKKGSAVVVRVLGERAARAVRSLNERGYPLRRKDRKVYPMYNLRPYGSRGWPTFETSAASIVLAHLMHLKRLPKKALSDKLKLLLESLEASGPKLMNIDVIGAPREVEVAQSPELLLHQCKRKLRSEQVFFTGKADQKDVIQLLSDFEDSIAVEFDQKRAEHLKLRTEELVRARTEQLGEARRTRFHKMLQHLTVQEKPMPILHVSVPTHTIQVVPTLTVAPKAPLATNMVDGLIGTFRAALFTSRAVDRDLNAQKGSSGQGVTCVSSEESIYL